MSARQILEQLATWPCLIVVLIILAGLFSTQRFKK